jgi:3-hydroxy-3-methylglutaryl CoA synthase
MGYSINPADVRVDFFKPLGKWYTTEQVRWTGEYYAKKQLLRESFAQSLRDHFKDTPNKFSDLDAVCLHPYHEYAHPIQIKQGGWNK